MKASAAVLALAGLAELRIGFRSSAPGQVLDPRRVEAGAAPAGAADEHLADRALEQAAGPSGC